MQTNMTQKNTVANMREYRCLTFLTIIYFIGWATSYLMLYRIVGIHTILEASSVFLFPLSYTVADLITEVYGYAVARQVLWASIIGGFLFCIALTLINKIPAADFWRLQASYNVVFHPILRAYFVLLIANLSGSIVNIYLMSKCKIILKGRLFWLRSLYATGAGEFIFSIIVGPIGFIGVESLQHIIQLIIYGYIFKMLYAFVAVFPVSILAKVLKRVEKIDVYDYGINYNPFKLDIKS